MKIIKVLLLLMLAPIMLFAEGGSVYSRYALGDLNYAFSARRMALGGLGLALYDQSDVGTLNPAAWSRINLTRFNVGLNYNGFGIKDNNSSAFYSGTQFAGFSLAIPIEKSYGITLVLGITPYSIIEYDVTEERTAAEFPHSLYFEGEGGLSRTFIGASYQLPFMTIGGSIDYYIGNIDYSSGIDFSSTSIRNTEFNKTYKLSGLGGNFGIISDDLYKYIQSGSTNEFRLAFVYTLSQQFDADTSLSVTSYSNTREEPTSSSTSDLATGKANVNIPSRMGVGLSFLYDRSYNILVDYFYQPWSKYKFTEKTFDNLRDLQKISVGLEYKSSADSRTAGFWEHISLRTGLSYEQTQYVINGTEINQLSFMGGFSIPLDNVNTIDFGLEYAMRGTNDNNLIKENLIKMNVTLNLGELWFFRQ